jgi:hypothetical protein
MVNLLAHETIIESRMGALRGVVSRTRIPDDDCHYSEFRISGRMNMIPSTNVRDPYVGP